jgi:acetyl-CoA C-acetyltransferase
MACGYLATQQMDRFLIAGGVESMSRVPLGSDGGAWYLDPDVAIPVHYIPQGVSADLIATLYGYSREDVDHYATLSHQRAHHATIQGYFHKSMIPVKDVIGNVILKEDETIRPDTSPETLATLPPAFEKVGNEWGFNAVALKKFPHLQSIHHVHHAGNSSGLADGAALVLLGTRETGALYGLKPRATIVSFAITGTDPTLMLLGPAPATRKALKRARMEVSDIDLFEVNEAFASVVLYYMDELKIPIEKVNVNGGAIAMGHPLGATGAMLLNILLDELERRDLEFGVVSMCIGGGMGIATVIQRVVNSHA